MNNIFKFNPEILKSPKNPTFGEFFETPDSVDNQTHPFEENEIKPSLEAPDSIDLDSLSLDQNECYISSDIPDFPDNCLKFISDILLEENLDENPASAQEFRALQATEKLLYDVLGESYPPSSDSFPESLNQNNESPDSSSSNKSFSSFEPQSDPIVNVDDFVHSILELNPQTSGSSSEDSESNKLSPATSERREKPVKGPRKKKNRQRDDTDEGGGRSNKIQAASSDDYVEMKEYDDVLLCSETKENECLVDEARAKLSNSGGNRSRKNHGKKQNVKIKEVDLRTLLLQCAQAVSSFDLRTANDLLKQIRQHCSPYGDSIQRLAHHVANGLEARLAGTGSTVSTNICDTKISPSDFLKAYRVYVSAIPFKRMTYFLANNTILKLVEKATKIHIIDFGVFLGLQWPCFIQALSKRPNGPPKLRITGVDFPQQGFRPAERVNATGRRLSGYCERFGVPFEYEGIVDKWENMQPNDFRIDNDEIVIVNSMWRSGTMLDETVEANSPRDAFLRLIRNLEPDLFIHAICNGTFTAPFFINRFKEALFHYSSAFEVFDATLPREAHERLLIESEVYGKEITNVVACEGVERVQRPETYKQWQVRTARAGLRQVPLEREFLSQSKAMVKANYHKDFLVDEDRNWMLQGWKGRISCALSFWKPS
ncbi:Scarecrow-like protein 14 [Bienertia sinuspersici]